MGPASALTEDGHAEVRDLFVGETEEFAELVKPRRLMLSELVLGVDSELEVGHGVERPAIREGVSNVSKRPIQRSYIGLDVVPTDEIAQDEVVKELVEALSEGASTGQLVQAHLAEAVHLLGVFVHAVNGKEEVPAGHVAVLADDVRKLADILAFGAVKLGIKNYGRHLKIPLGILRLVRSDRLLRTFLSIE